MANYHAARNLKVFELLLSSTDFCQKCIAACQFSVLILQQQANCQQKYNIILIDVKLLENDDEIRCPSPCPVRVHACVHVCEHDCVRVHFRVHIYVRVKVSWHSILLKRNFQQVPTKFNKTLFSIIYFFYFVLLRSSVQDGD